MGNYPVKNRCNKGQLSGHEAANQARPATGRSCGIRSATLFTRMYPFACACIFIPNEIWIARNEIALRLIEDENFVAGWRVGLLGFLKCIQRLDKILSAKLFSEKNRLQGNGNSWKRAKSNSTAKER